MDPVPLRGAAVSLDSGAVSLPPQKGPRSGKDRVKKGGSYMCHKVSGVPEPRAGGLTAGPWTSVSIAHGVLSSARIDANTDLPH